MRQIQAKAIVQFTGLITLLLQELAGNTHPQAQLILCTTKLQLRQLHVHQKRWSHFPLGTLSRRHHLCAVVWSPLGG